jgi:hypothetical protein
MNVEWTSGEQLRYTTGKYYVREAKFNHTKFQLRGFSILKQFGNS